LRHNRKPEIDRDTINVTVPLALTELCLKADGLCLYPLRRTAVWLDQSLCLTKREFDILEVFLINPGAVLSPVQVLDQIGILIPGDGTTNSFERTISTLRKKLAAASSPLQATFIQTVRGMGYRLEILVTEPR
jgi:DNA-binding response OmpR family regulator